MHKLLGGFNINSKHEPDILAPILGEKRAGGAPFLVVTREHAPDLWKSKKPHNGWVQRALAANSGLEAILYRVMYWQDVFHPSDENQSFSLSGWLRDAQLKDGVDMFEIFREIEAAGVKVYVAGPNEYAPRLQNGEIDWARYEEFIGWELRRVNELKGVGIRPAFMQAPVGWLTDEIWDAWTPVRNGVFDDSELHGAVVEHEYGIFGTMAAWMQDNLGEDIFNSFGDPPTPFPTDLDRTIEAYLVGRSCPIITGENEDIIIGEVGLDHKEVPEDFYPLKVLAEGKDIGGWRDHDVVWKNAKKLLDYPYEGDKRAEYFQQLRWYYENFSGFPNRRYAAPFGVGPGWYDEKPSDAPFISHDVTSLVPELLDFWQTDYGRESVDEQADPDPQPVPIPPSPPAPQNQAYWKALLSVIEAREASLRLQADALKMEAQAIREFLEVSEGEGK